MKLVEIEDLGLVTDEFVEEIQALFLANNMDRPLALAGFIALAKHSKVYVAFEPGTSKRRPRVVGIIAHGGRPLVAQTHRKTDLAERLHLHAQAAVKQPPELERAVEPNEPEHAVPLFH